MRAPRIVEPLGGLRTTWIGQKEGARHEAAVAGVGNNISALVQGIGFYRQLDDEEELPGIAHPVLGGLRVTDIDVVAAFDVSETKAGRPLSEAIFAAPNNYPVLGAPQMTEDPEVLPGIADPDDEQQLTSVTKILRELDVEVLLYSLPTGLPEVARAYGRAAIAAGVAVVNCTPDPVAGLPDLQAEARAQGVPLVGDDLQSHLGSSIVHGALLALLEERGLRSAAPTRSTWAATPTSPTCASTAPTRRRPNTGRCARRSAAPTG
ncbi:hypothetical protein SFUMM280S_09996 [Streptomyces fumanus]